MMKTNFPFTQLCALAFLTMMSITSFANDGCTTQKTFGPESTFTAESRSIVTPWLLNVEDDYSCLSMQRYYDGEFIFEGELIQTMTACANGELTLLYVNGVVTAQGTTGQITMTVIDPEGNEVGESTTQGSQNMSHLVFEFNETDLRDGEQYALYLTTAEGVEITFNTLSDQQYLNGHLTVNGLEEMQNLCFIGLVDESDVVVLDDGTHDHGDVDHNSYDEWDPWGHDFHVKPPSDVEELKHSVYPNPFVSDFRVELQTMAEVPGTVTLYNFMGKKVFEQNIENISETDFIKISPENVLNKGYYTLRIEYDENIILDTILKN